MLTSVPKRQLKEFHYYLGYILRGLEASESLEFIESLNKGFDNVLRIEEKFKNRSFFYKKDNYEELNSFENKNIEIWDADMNLPFIIDVPLIKGNISEQSKQLLKFINRTGVCWLIACMEIFLRLPNTNFTFLRGYSQNTITTYFNNFLPHLIQKEIYKKQKSYTYSISKQFLVECGAKFNAVFEHFFKDQLNLTPFYIREYTDSDTSFFIDESIEEHKKYILDYKKFFDKKSHYFYFENLPSVIILQNTTDVKNFNINDVEKAFIISSFGEKIIYKLFGVLASNFTNHLISFVLTKGGWVLSDNGDIKHKGTAYLDISYFSLYPENEQFYPTNMFYSKVTSKIEQGLQQSQQINIQRPLEKPEIASSIVYLIKEFKKKLLYEHMINNFEQYEPFEQIFKKYKIDIKSLPHQTQKLIIGFFEDLKKYLRITSVIKFNVTRNPKMVRKNIDKFEDFVTHKPMILKKETKLVNIYKPHTCFNPTCKLGTSGGGRGDRPPTRRNIVRKLIFNTSINGNLSFKRRYTLENVSFCSLQCFYNFGRISKTFQYHKMIKRFATFELFSRYYYNNFLVNEMNKWKMSNKEEEIKKVLNSYDYIKIYMNIKKIAKASVIRKKIRIEQKKEIKLIADPRILGFGNFYLGLNGMHGHFFSRTGPIYQIQQEQSIFNFSPGRKATKELTDVLELNKEYAKKYRTPGVLQMKEMHGELRKIEFKIIELSKAISQKQILPGFFIAPYEKNISKLGKQTERIFRLKELKKLNKKLKKYALTLSRYKKDKKERKQRGLKKRHSIKKTKALNRDIAKVTKKIQKIMIINQKFHKFKENIESDLLKLLQKKQLGDIFNPISIFEEDEPIFEKEEKIDDFPDLEDETTF